MSRCVTDCLQGVYLRTRSEWLATSTLSEIVKVLGADRSVTTISTVDVETLIRYYQARHNAPATINRKLAVFSRLLRHARDLGHDVQPVPIRKMREPSSRTRVLTKKEQERLLSCAQSLDGSLTSLFRFLLGTGCRLGEALRLKWIHVDLDRNWVRFEETKGDLPRGVPISDSLVAELTRLKGQAKAGPFLALTQRRVTYLWNKCRAEMNLCLDSEFVPHALRHTCATELVASGVSIQVIQRWLGHKTLAMTQRYAHVHDDMLIAALRKRHDG